MFYEVSTRTSCSFQAAMLRLGGNTIAVNEVIQTYLFIDICLETIVTRMAYLNICVMACNTYLLYECESDDVPSS